MKNHRHTAAQDPKELLTELQALVADAEKMIGDSAGEASEGVMDALRSRYENVQERLTDFYSTAKKKVVAGAKYTDTTIRENPYQALAVAAGLGLLVGVLLGRRSRSD
jgi:ElaB/YqjD/DUF883 family membrane-anchored ribosome-binding protein